MKSIFRFIGQLSPRLVYGLGFLACTAAALISIFYFQIYKGLVPCTLCELQRLIVIVLSLLYLVALIHGPKTIGNRIYGLLLFLISLCGLLVAVHQVWLQYHPHSQAASCGPGLNYLLATLPLKDALITIFHGSADCAQVGWQFLSISIAGWCIVFFSGLCIMNMWQTMRKYPNAEFYLFHHTRLH